MVEITVRPKLKGYSPKSKILTTRHYTPNGYIVPTYFGDVFLPDIDTIPEHTKLHLN